MGTFTTGAEITVEDGRLRIQRDGAVAKFVDQVEHITFSGARAQATGQCVLYVTERCVLRLGPRGVELIEIAPGIDLERDVLAKMNFRPEVTSDLREMDAVIFSHARLGLMARPPPTLEARIRYRAEDDIVLLTLGGLAIEGMRAAERAVDRVDWRLRELDRGDNVVVDCDDFDLGQPGAPRFLQLLREHETSRSWAWCCTDALHRRRIGRACSDVDVRVPIHASLRAALDSLGARPFASIAGWS
jgi:propionate CoA-transferase